ncbi:MAG: hypothetical protein OXC44_01125 [Proteobacteria bacterium]|nr:hypothetical protein [Pseudomonadota bacterium]
MYLQNDRLMAFYGKFMTSHIASVSGCHVIEDFDMLKLEFDHKRMQERQKLTGLLPGKILILRTSRYLSSRAVDASKSGIGILSSASLEVGEKLLLSTSQFEIPLRVLYKQKDYAKSNCHRYGFVVDPDYADRDTIDMIAIFKDSGCMKPN